MAQFVVNTGLFEIESIPAVKAEVAKDETKSAPGITLTGRSLSLRWPDFVVRVSGGQRPIFAMNKATIVFLEGQTNRGPVVKIVFSGEPQGEFMPSTDLSIKILTENKVKGVIDEWQVGAWGASQFCYPPKPPYTEERTLGPFDDVDFFSQISIARLVIPAMAWYSCPNVQP
jgi:hypothetical protein